MPACAARRSPDERSHHCARRRGAGSVRSRTEGRPHEQQDMLTKAGYEVLSTDNGEDAIAKARSSKPDLILMDVVMPGLNGFQATRAISRDPETRSIPVIMCTSKSQETDKIWGLRQGARDYVVKPVVRDELLAKITSLGRRRKSAGNDSRRPPRP